MKMEELQLRASFWKLFFTQSSARSSILSASHFLLTFSDLGHYNLFIKGILHRDISVGNILRYSEPVQRPALDK